LLVFIEMQLDNNTSRKVIHILFRRIFTS